MSSSDLETELEWDDQIEKVVDEISVAARRLLFDPSVDWHLCKETPTVKIYKRKREKRAGHMFKAVAILDSDFETFSQLLYICNPYRLQWDPNIQSYEILHKFDKNNHVVNMAYKPVLGGLVTGRDSVLAIRREVHDSEFRSVYIGSDEKLARYFPPKCGLIRGFSFPSGMAFKAIGEQKTEVRSVLDSDMNLPALVPTALVEAALPTAILHFYKAMSEAPSSIPIHTVYDLPGWSFRHTS